jgi:hypothetical protein
MQNLVRSAAVVLAVTFAAPFSSVAHADTLSFDEDDVLWWEGLTPQSPFASMIASIRLHDDKGNYQDIANLLVATGHDGVLPTGRVLFGFTQNYNYTVDWKNSWLDYGDGPVSLAGVARDDWEEPWLDYNEEPFTWNWGFEGGSEKWATAGINSWYLDVSDYDYFQIKAGQFVYNLAAVPEPETYAMMLAGLGLVGVVARRRRLARR